MQCPHCRKSIGTLSKGGEHRVRLRIVLIDPETNRIHGPCGKCGEDVTIATGADLSKALTHPLVEIRPGIRLEG